MNKKLKIIAIVVLLAGIFFAVTQMLPKKKSTASSLLTKETGTLGTTPMAAPSPTALSGDFAMALSTITGIDLDTTLFANPSYKALRDYPVNLGTDTVGRVNPFAPVGVDDSNPIATDNSSQVQTLQPAKVTSTTAEFSAQVTLGNKVPATVVFEYGTTDTFGSASTPTAVKTTGAVVSRITTLAPATTYYVRAVLVQGAVTTIGNTMTFITSANTR